MNKTGSKITNERKPKKKLEADTEEPQSSAFDCLPIDMEIVIFSFVICEMEKPWDRNWNNISLVSKHWNSIAWISFQRTIPKSEKITIFKRACKKGRFHFINKLLTQDATLDPSDDNNYAIRISSKKGFSDIVKFLLQDKRVDPSAYQYPLDDSEALAYASMRGHIDVVKLLLQDKRVVPSLNAINWACMCGRIDVVKLLFKIKKVDRNNSSLHMTCENGMRDVGKLLI